MTAAMNANASRASLTLVSHALCPYVQRAAIVLHEKGVAFERIDVDLAAKPAWFLRVSPLGKTPVLLVGGEPVFESAVICDYLDETTSPRLHPRSPLARARHRGWIAFASALLDAIGAFYNAGDEAALAARANDIRGRLAQLEAAFGDGPWFAGPRFSVVDAAIAPAFRYFEVFDAIDDFGWFAGLPKVDGWRRALAERSSVRRAAHPDYAERLSTFLLRRGSALSRRMTVSVQDVALSAARKGSDVSTAERPPSRPCARSVSCGATLTPRATVRSAPAVGRDAHAARGR